VSGAVTISLPSQSITNAYLATMAANTVKANLTGNSATPTDVSPSAILDTFGSQVGSILYRGSSGWAALTSGTNAQVLTATGTTSAPTWTSLALGTMASQNANAVAITGGTVQPASVTVNATNNYNFSGTMGGGGTVTKGGTGTLFLPNNNSYTGLTVITNGLIAISASGALGTSAAGTLISGSGTLDIDTGANIANTLNLGAEVLTISGNGFGGQGAVVNNSAAADQINAVQQIVLNGNSSIGGVSRWDMRGTGNALDMQSTNTLTKVGGNYIALVSTVVNNPGNIVVNGGTLGIQVAANLGGSSANTLTVKNGARLEMYQLANNPTWSLVLNSNALLNPDNGFGGWDGPVTITGPVTFQADASLTINGAISGTGSIIKTGNQTASLTASNSYTGDTTVGTGTLIVSYASFASGSTISVSNSAVLNLNFTGTNTVAALVLNGVSQPAGVYDATSGAPYLTGTGALQVVPASAPTMSVTSSGTSLQITFAGGTLQVQTNSLSNGLGTNWVNYPGTSPVTVPINPANGSVFFRVKQ
jgi:autotransporter-associated beta strand protein